MDGSNKVFAVRKSPRRARQNKNNQTSDVKEGKSTKEQGSEHQKSAPETFGSKKVVKRGIKRGSGAEVKTEKLQSEEVKSVGSQKEVTLKIGKKSKLAAKSQSITKKTETAPKPPNRSILQLKVSLLDVAPPIWRRIQVLNSDTFADLHSHIKEAVGWISGASYRFIIYNPKTNSNIILDDGSLDEFCPDLAGDPNWLKSQLTKLSKFLTAKDDRILYEFDVDGGWTHEIVVEKILPPPGPKAEYPKCTGGKRACPPEDCGNVEGFMHLLEVYKDPSHEEYGELIGDWLNEYSPGWEPDKFDKKQIFKRVWTWVFTK